MLVAAVVGGLSAVGLVAFLNFVNGQEGYVACTIASGPGWLVPLLTGVGIAGIVWSRLRTQGDVRGGRRVSLTQCHCGTCGGRVLEDWRLCPHCGASLADTSTSSAIC
jgi:hypothetical protein